MVSGGAECWQGGVGVHWPGPALPCDLLANPISQLAPENTLMSLRKTAKCGAAVFETDVMVR